MIFRISAARTDPSWRTAGPQRAGSHRKRAATRRWCGGLLLACLAMPAVAEGPVSAPPDQPGVQSPNALWRLIRACTTAAGKDLYPPRPCVEVEMPRGSANHYAVLKDREGRYQYLVLPLARITGIESPTLLAPGAPNYFADAWTARLYVEAALHRRLPRDQLSLVVNSAYGRSQNQLHIHVDCTRPDVHDALQRMLPNITTQWRPLPMPLPPNGHAYQARWVDGETLTLNPFQSLAASLPAGDHMARHSLIVAGAVSPSGKPGFILLSGRVDWRKGDHATGDELQDLACTIAARSSP